MAWRVVAIEKPARISLKDNKLVISQEDEVKLPLEDIDTLLIDNHEVVMTANILEALAKFGVNTIICDEKHLPSTIILPHGQASRGAKNARMQLTIGEALKKQLWRKNIMQKIENQAEVLRRCGYFKEAEKLDSLSKTVRSGDVGNNEATAARIYFDTLLGDATRRKPMWYNSALNYGYAIVRGSIARAASSRGLITEIGINHHSELNSYNLVDDLIESFRPIVDFYIISKVASGGEEDFFDTRLSKEERNLILDFMNSYGIIVDKRCAIKHITDTVVESFINAISLDNVDEFILPTLDNK